MWTTGDLGMDAALLAALTRDHRMQTRVLNLTGWGESVDIAVQPGSQATASVSSRVSRDATLVVDRHLTDAGLLDPLSDWMTVSTGVAGLPLVPVFTGRVVAHSERADGQVQVHCASVGADVVGFPFEVPWAATAGSTTQEIRWIVADVSADIAVTVAGDVRDDAVPSGLVWEEDRGKALDDLAAGINAIWLPDRTGGIAVGANPFAAATPPDPPIVLRDGEGGVLVGADPVRSREHITNSVTVIVERSDNTPPIRVTARDEGATSATRWGGPFGKRGKILKIQTPLGESEATGLAMRILAQSLALARSWQITMPHLPLLDPVDVPAVWYRDEVTAQFVESVTYNLDAAVATKLSTRQLLVGADADTTITM
jgi:hypothetical protein